MIPIIAYYTIDSPYENDARVLKENLRALKIPHNVQAIDSVGGWQENTQLKAKFIRTWMTEHPEQPYFVYLDVDAFVIKQPTFFDGLAKQQIQFAAAIFNNSELLSGTLFFANTPTTHALVDHWIQLNRTYPKTLPNGKNAWDQRTLKMAVQSDLQKGTEWVELPLDYTFIIGLSQIRYPEITAPTIIHTRGHLRYGE